MKLAVIASLLAATTASADVTIMDNHKMVTVDCAKDRVVNLVGNDITVTLTGTCEKVITTGNRGTVTGSATTAYVTGNSNQLALDGVDVITVVGNKNTVSYKRALGKQPTKISNAGKGNTITRK